MTRKPKHGRRPVAGAICLALIASGCTAKDPQIVTVRQEIPSRYYQPTPHPSQPGPATEANLQYCKQMREALEACNLDKAEIETLLKGQNDD